MSSFTVRLGPHLCQFRPEMATDRAHDLFEKTLLHYMKNDILPGRGEGCEFGFCGHDAEDSLILGAWRSIWGRRFPYGNMKESTIVEALMRDQVGQVFKHAVRDLSSRIPDDGVSKLHVLARNLDQLHFQTPWFVPLENLLTVVKKKLVNTPSVEDVKAAKAAYEEVWDMEVRFKYEPRQRAAEILREIEAIFEEAGLENPNPIPEIEE